VRADRQDATIAAVKELDPLELLDRTPLFHDLEPNVRRLMASGLERVAYAADDTIFQQGARPESIYFIAMGRVELTRKEPESGQHHVAAYERGDIFGQMEFLFPQPRHSQAIALEPVVLYRWQQPEAAAFLKKYPAVMNRLKFMAESRRKAIRIQFDWLDEGEVIHGLARRHEFILYQRLTIPVILLAGGIFGVMAGLSAAGSFVLWAGIGAALAGAAFGLWQWVDWLNDFYIVTGKRAVWVEKVVALYDSRREAPLHSVLSVSISTDVAGRALGYGDVIIRTYTGKVVFKDTDNPQALAAVVEQYWRRLQEREDEADRDALQELLTKRLAPQPSEEETIEKSLQEGPDDDEPQEIPVGMRGLNFRIRFEDKGVITYRKHWAVLLREIGLPSALITLAFGVLGARLGGLLEFMTLSAALTFSLLALVPLSAWWVYRYVDWANDIYQVTHDQIVDIYKKPLGRENRKVAPLENILGTEVDRKGLVGVLLNYGDVIANVGTTQFIFEGVFDPIGVQQDIVHAQEAFMLRSKEKERRQRRNEMIELIDIYHGQYTSRPGERPDATDEGMHDDS
jgi:hypothetical protein